MRTVLYWLPSRLLRSQRVYDRLPWLYRRVWFGMPSDYWGWAIPRFMPRDDEAEARTEADLAAGRYYKLDPETRDFVPNPDWPKNGPQP